MGKNQQHKAMQASRHVSGSGGDDAGGTTQSVDGMVDASFHTPEWHAARIAQLTTERMTWEEWKIKKKEDDKKKAAEEDAEENLMREYRKQLDADREGKLARGWNHKDLRGKVRDKSAKKRKHSSKEKKDKKDKKSKKDSKDKKEKKSKRSSKKRRKESSRHADSGDDSDSDGSSGSSDGGKEEQDDDNKYRLSNFFEGK